MKRVLDVKVLGRSYVFIFPWLFLLFFEKYFGPSLQSIERGSEDGDFIRLKVFFFGKKERFVRAEDGVSTIYVPVVGVLRALVRSVFQILVPRSSSIGLFEYFVLLIRKGFLEPLELDMAKQGFFLVHGALLTKECSGTLMLVAPSKGGKSTVSKILEGSGYQVVGDNYVFFDGSRVVTIPECRRSGRARRFSFSFYGKAVHDAPFEKELEVDKIFWLSFSSAFDVKSLSSNRFLKRLSDLYLVEGEGCFEGKQQAVYANFKKIDHGLKGVGLYDLEMVKSIPETRDYLKRCIDDRVFCS